MGVYEIMEVTSPIRRGIHRAVPAHELRDILRREGWRSLREEGVEAAIAGKSTLEEILRVTQEDEDPAPSLPAPILAQGPGDAAPVAQPAWSVRGPGHRAPRRPHADARCRVRFSYTGYDRQGGRGPRGLEAPGPGEA